MYEFDVKYTFDDYYEYYKREMIFGRLWTDFIFSVILIGYAIYYLINQENANLVLPIISIVLGATFPLIKFAYIPVLKKQLKSKQDQIDKTHIKVTFNEENVLYENKSEKDEETTDKKDNSFNLEYNNFMKVKELTNLYLFYLNSKTTIIIPKRCGSNELDEAEFKKFLSLHIDPKRIKLK